MSSTSLPRVHLVIGTRPEAVKMAPLVQALRSAGVVDPVIVTTGQHPAMVAQALDAFGLSSDVLLELQRRTGEQVELAAQLAPALDRVVKSGSAAVVVQGDTTSAFVGGLVAMWRRIPLVHLEAGLRSGDLAAPFPEEANRRMLSVFADLHLAPTKRAAAVLRKEGVLPERCVLTGNTVVDAVLEVAAIVTAPDSARPKDPDLAAVHELVAAGAYRLMLVTAHRRESWGTPLQHILEAVRQIVDEHTDLQCVLPAHPNPAIRAQVDATLAGHDRVTITDPLPYKELCRLVARSALILSDSGGIQEEAPTFGVPVLVLRNVTERLEAVEAGWASLVGTDPARIVAEAKGILDGARELPQSSNPFGDGKAGQRGAQAIAWLLGHGERPPDLVLQ